MQKKFYLLLGICVALASNSLAQSHPNSRSASGPRESVRLSELERGLAEYMEGDDDDDLPDPLSRPRIVRVKESSVKSSVVVNMAAAERTAFQLINQKRMENGLQPLAWSDEMAAVARVHSQNMAQYNFFSHRGLDSKMVSDRADERGLRKWRAIGENIAYNRGYSDPVSKAVDLWLNSASHRRNLLDNNWKETAVGVAVAADGSYYFTQVFWVRK